MRNYIVKEESLTAIADSIRSKTGETDELVFPDGFVSGIEKIEIEEPILDIYLTAEDFVQMGGRTWVHTSDQTFPNWNGIVWHLRYDICVKYNPNDTELTTYSFEVGDRFSTWRDSRAPDCWWVGSSINKFRMVFDKVKIDENNTYSYETLGPGYTLLINAIEIVYAHIYYVIDPLCTYIGERRMTKSMPYLYSGLKESNLPLIDTRCVTNMDYMFYDADVTGIPLYDTSNVTSMRYMFQHASADAIPHFNTSKVDNMCYTFAESSGFYTIPLLNTSSVTHAPQMFWCCAIKEIPSLNLSKATNLTQWCTYSDLLTKIGHVDIRAATQASSFLNYCYNLTECYLRNIKISLQVSDGSTWGHLLTVDSLLHLIKECRQTSSIKTLTIGTANMAKLANTYVKVIDITDEMRAEDDLIDEKLPFEVCESTDEGAMLISEYVLLKNWQLK